ncbi:MAG: alpha-galactosidase [Clostridia bacterium]|nr:alpha-galactosidase [Clostridia bacterium]
MAAPNEKKTVLSTFTVGDMTLQYVYGEESKNVGISLLPTAMAHLAVEKVCWVESMVQSKIMGDTYPGPFTQGRTMRPGGCTPLMNYESQRTWTEDGTTTVETLLKDPRGYAYTHTLTFKEKGSHIAAHTTFANKSSEKVTLEMLANSSFGMLSPFTEDDGPDTLELWRMRSTWSAEGRLVHESVEEAHMEPSWQPIGSNSKRWGQVGSMPVREYAPFAAVEDKIFGVVWGIQLANGGSWQLEAGRCDNGFFLSGGQADREFGHWTKDFAPGESFTTEDAIFTVTAAGVDDACERLLQYTEDRLDVPESEETLPAMFNEWCTTWGVPSEESICAIANKLKGLGLPYFVIDAGWFTKKDGGWASTAGEWNVAEFLYPHGFDYSLDTIRACGMQPGIWFELEVVGCNSTCFDELSDWMLFRDGKPLTVGTRRFWDFRKPEVRDYLQKKVIDFLKEHNFKYLKIDYNDTIGIGADGAESQGESLRQQVEAVQDFMRSMHAQLPELVIEMCSSGGHRLVPSFLTLGSLASTSDAHECDEIPVIGARLHRMVLPRQNQLWVVLHKEQTEAHFYYKLTSGFLGRLCLSGDVLELSDKQWAIIRECLDFYNAAGPVLKHGKSRLYGPEMTSWRHPKGWQALVRHNEDTALAVVHTFYDAPKTVRFPVPAGYTVEKVCAREGVAWAHAGDHIVLTNLADMDGLGILLKKV